MRLALKMLRDLAARLKSGYFHKAPEHIRLGKLGEDLACNALRHQGYRLVDRNVKIYKREVDVIAVEKGTLVFVEVKARSDHSFGKPLEAVDTKRRNRLRKAAELYALGKKMKNVSIRFDVVTVDFSEDNAGTIEIIKNAF